MKNRFIILTVLVFVLLSVLFYAMRSFAPAYQFAALEGGNMAMALLSLLTFFIVTRQVDSRPMVFVRSVYSASFVKLIMCMVLILAYILLNRAHIHKPSVFMLFGIYVVYTVMEALILSRAVKE